MPVIWDRPPLPDGVDDKDGRIARAAQGTPAGALDRRQLAVGHRLEDEHRAHPPDVAHPRAHLAQLVAGALLLAVVGISLLALRSDGGSKNERVIFVDSQTPGANPSPAPADGTRTLPFPVMSTLQADHHPLRGGTVHQCSD